MTFRKVLQYFLFGSLVAAPKATGDFHDTNISVHTQQTVEIRVPSQQEQIESKAKELCDTYIDFVLQGQKNIKNGQGGHRKSVLREFPGAYTRWYCIYGQYTQLNRALAELGDTINLIPFNGRHSCPEFRRLMKNKYSGNEYAGALHNGKMFRSDKAYNSALKAYLRNKNVNAETSDSVRQAVINRFAKNNFSIESLHPGTILIIQWNDSPSNTHAVMFLGKGRVENGKFISDSAGKYMYAGYNNETIEDVFKISNTNHIFAADIYNIACVSYEQELKKLKGMKNSDLFRYIYDAPIDRYVMVLPRQTLQDMAASKYFYKNKQDFVPKPVLPKINLAKINFTPTFLVNLNKEKTK